MSSKNNLNYQLWFVETIERKLLIENVPLTMWLDTAKYMECNVGSTFLIGSLLVAI